jgi:hypothetical protein
MTWKVPVSERLGLQVELTNHCNAACHACARVWLVKNKDKKDWHEYDLSVNDNYVSLEDFKGWVDKDKWTRLKRILFCGNYDEPTINPDVIEICKWIIDSKTLFPALPKITISTNGGARNEEFYSELGKLSKDNPNRLKVNFGIDGFEDTNHLYRVNVKWEKLQKNWRAYIAAGGEAWWQWIEFSHNSHQKHLVADYAKKEGFVKIKRINSWRPNVAGAKNVGYIEKKESPKIVPDCYKNTMDSQGIFINYQGYMTPCCWMATNSGFKGLANNFSNDHGKDGHKLNGTNSIQSVFDSQWFTDFAVEMEAGKIPVCTTKCKENKTNYYNFQDIR